MIFEIWVIIRAGNEGPQKFHHHAPTVLLHYRHYAKGLYTKDAKAIRDGRLEESMLTNLPLMTFV